MNRGFWGSVLVVGAAFGFLLTASGLGDYDTIHDGLLLENPYIFLMMGSATAVASAGLALLRRRAGRATPARWRCRTSGSRGAASTAGRSSAWGSESAPPAPALRWR